MSDAEHVDAVHRQAATEAGAAAVLDKPSSAHCWLHIVGAVLVAVVLPLVLMGVLVGSWAVSAMFMGLVLGVVGSKIGGTQRMLPVAPVIGIAAGLGAFTAHGWWWAAVLAGAGVIAGAGIRFGWLPALLMVPYAATFVTPRDSGTDAAAYGAIVAIGTLYGVVIARRFGAPAAVDGDHLSLPVASAVAIVFGLILGGGAAIGAALTNGERIPGSLQFRSDLG